MPWLKNIAIRVKEIEELVQRQLRLGFGRKEETSVEISRQPGKALVACV